MQPNSNAGLPRWYCLNRPPLALAKIILIFHWLSLPILLSLTAYGAGRNQPDFVATPRINNQNSTKGIHANCDKPIFIKMLIWDGDCQSVCEDQHCISKVNPVFTKIGYCFFPVPLIIYLTIVCIFVHAAWRNWNGFGYRAISLSTLEGVERLGSRISLRLIARSLAAR